MKHLDPVLLLLTYMIVFLVLLMVWEAMFLKNDSQTFQVISTLLSGFSGAFLMRVKPDQPKADQKPEEPVK